MEPVSMENMPSEWMLLLPELFLGGMAFILLLIGVYARPKITCMLISIAFLSLIAALALVSTGNASALTALNGMFVSNAYTIMAKQLLLIGASLVLLVSSGWLKEEGGRAFEYLVLFLFSTLGLMLLISAGDMLAFYMGLELSSLALYVLASFERDHAKSSEAGLKYFMLGALASGMLLFGISLVYGFTGTINFASLSEYFSGFADEAGNGESVPKAAIVGMVLVIIAFCFKLSAVPFHMWTPDVYEGAPTPVTTFFAVAPKIGAMALFLRVLMVPFGDVVEYWQQIVIFASVASLVVGSFAAINQTNFKRLLAYSSIGHVGFMLMGVATGNNAGAEGVLIYLFVYIFMSAGAFGCLLLLKKDGNYLENLADLSGLSRTHPVLAAALALFMFSMAGIPPLAGFFGKMFVILAVMQHGPVWLAVVGLLTSVVSCYYYLKVVKLMYFDDPTLSVEMVATSSLRVGAKAVMIDTVQPLCVRFGIGICAAVTLAYVLYPGFLVDHAKAASLALLP